ncbi:MAG: prolipoprotein diacylglyceryl transferase [Francisellaceae bacterium]|jgi:phosphatidylglycerol---prolipoprotein diacylglyceryl transferase|nr:prolipoprotein diacylglyceryl transferase [Francisellaceae bacterium]MBT6207116.1 prolipoprotein diacylglyceryl transferase [Francisellaceae bacterium]MBT6539909.1 prolipoprotein diacylglyceryl transferase [Francisellaceae bacterium]
MFVDPIALDLGVVQIYWYGILYLVAFALAYILLIKRRQLVSPGWTKDQVSDLIFFAAIGVIIGGRFGYILVYQPELMMARPFSLFEFWAPGRSFHGGAVGVLLCFWVFAKKYHIKYFQVTDFVAPVIPIGIFLGRFGNFINGELWGRVTDVSWGVVFPHVGQLARHPSSLYEMFLEGFLLYVLLDIVRKKTNITGIVSATFLIGYGVTRFIAEYFREPDYGIGFVIDGLTMGQLLSLPMVIIGLLLAFNFKSKARLG